MRNRYKYPVNWFDEIRPEVLKRDKYKCSNCGIQQRAFGYYDKIGVFIECDEFITAWAKKQGFKPRRIWLQVAHLDQDTTNNAPSNLKTLCPKCHLSYDNVHNVAKRLQSKKSRKL